MKKLKEIAEENQRKILVILRSGPKTWQELKELTKFSDRTLAKHLKSLLEKGLITEEIDRKDRRRKIYALSEKGLEATKENILSLALSIKLIKRFNPEIMKEDWNQSLFAYTYILGLLTFISIYFNSSFLKILHKVIDTTSSVINRCELTKILKEMNYKEQEIENVLNKIDTFLEREINNILLPFLVPTPKELIENVEKEDSYLEKSLAEVGGKIIILDSEIINFLQTLIKEKKCK